jgi:hypothetical protein
MSGRVDAHGVGCGAAPIHAVAEVGDLGEASVEGFGETGA